MELNINDYLVVKLTSRGTRVLSEWEASYYENAVCSAEDLFPTRPDGRILFIFWEFLMIFGNEIAPDKPPCFESEMTIERFQRDFFITPLGEQDEKVFN